MSKHRNAFVQHIVNQELEIFIGRIRNENVHASRTHPLLCNERSSLTRAKILKFMAFEYKLAESFLFHFMAFKNSAIKWIIYEGRSNMTWTVFLSSFIHFITSEQSYILLQSLLNTTRTPPPPPRTENVLIPTGKKSTHQQNIRSPRRLTGMS
jgi:hypothetical protein